MKKVVVLALTIVGLVACKSKENEPVETVQVKFNVLGLEVTQGVSARKAVMDTQDPGEAGLTDLWIMEGTEVLCHQVSTGSDFGSPTLKLTTGQHVLTFIGSGKTGQQVVSGVWSADKIGDTYGVVDTLDVQSGMPTQSVVIKRVNYVLKWESLDVVPNAAHTIEMTVSGHRRTLKAGLAGGDANPNYMISGVVTSEHGKPTTASSNGFCAVVGVQDVVTTTFVVKDINGKVLYSHSADVPVLSNRPTIIKGNLFGSTKSAVSVNKDWLEDYEVTL